MYQIVGHNIIYLFYFIIKHQSILISNFVNATYYPIQSLFKL